MVKFIIIIKAATFKLQNKARASYIENPIWTYYAEKL